LIQFTEAIRASNLGPILGEMLIDNLSGNRWLVSALEKGQWSIMKLRALFNITTEAFDNRNRRKEEEPNGHGRLKADAYKGAKVIEVEHPDLQRGDPCPEECDEHLYELSAPEVSDSEIMTILVFFHVSHYRTFKDFYICCVLEDVASYFPKAVSYARFISITPRVLELLTNHALSKTGN
jgi:hypothetical protein